MKQTMLTRAILCMLAVSAVAAGQPTPEADGPVRAVPVEAHLLPSHLTVKPGTAFVLAMEVTIQPEWIIYSPTPRGRGFRPIAAELAVEIADQDRIPVDDVTVLEVLWSPHEYHSDSLGSSYVYEGRMVVFVRLLPAEDAALGVRRISARLTVGACKADRCLPPMTVSTAEPIIIGVSPKTNPDWADSLWDDLTLARPAEELAGGGGVSGGDDSVSGRLLLAVLAGLILNIMPCVLPVIPLRILSIVDSAGGSRRRYVTLGLAFAAGVMVFFVGLAGVSVVLRLAFDQLFSWGRHFEIVWFRAAMGLLMVALAANLFGAFNVIVPRRIAELDERASARKGGHLGAGGMGLMLAILATPCSFALLISVLAWAQAQSLTLGTLAILLVGAGMAAPHALLAAFPKLADYLPRPGRWIELFKHAMGFAVLGVAVWLF
ncbi:MAG: cytochrome c biogenesis protein CcdA, partial [Planctomycetota bacterium]